MRTKSPKPKAPPITQSHPNHPIILKSPQKNANGTPQYCNNNNNIKAFYYNLCISKAVEMASIDTNVAHLQC